MGSDSRRRSVAVGLVCLVASAIVVVFLCVRQRSEQRAGSSPATSRTEPASTVTASFSGGDGAPSTESEQTAAAANPRVNEAKPGEKDSGKMGKPKDRWEGPKQGQHTRLEPCLLWANPFSGGC